MNSIPISLVVAMDRRRGIGRDGRLPWHLPADLAHFKALTRGNPVLMGRRTFESIGRPLPERRNLVLSRSSAFKPPGVTVFHDVESVLESLVLGSQEEELMVIGGADVYRLLLPAAGRIYLTEVQGQFECDTRFPAIDMGEWEQIRRVERPADARNPHDVAFIVLERRVERIRPSHH